MQTPPVTGDQGVFMRIIESAGAAIFGALVSLVAFRTRLALMDRELSDVKTQVAALKVDITAELKTQSEDTERRHKENHAEWKRHSDEMRRRSNMLLEVVASIARKVEVDHRFSDVLVRFLSEETRGDHDDHAPRSD